MMKWPGICLLAACAATLSATAAPVDAPSRPRVQPVVVSIPPQKFLVERIGRILVDVQVILEAGQSPETFEPTPSQMRQLSRARVYFPVGVPFEDAWLPEIRRQYPDLSIVDCCAQFLPGNEAGHGHLDPHVWVDPMSFLRVAALMHDALVRQDPVNGRVYDRNYRKLSEELTMLHRDLRYLLKDRSRDEFIISHGALGPLAAAYGLQQVALETGGREMGPRELARVVDLARRKGIRTVFVLKQHGRGPAMALAREIGASIAEIDPLAENYLENMRTIGLLLASATR